MADGTLAADEAPTVGWGVPDGLADAAGETGGRVWTAAVVERAAMDEMADKDASPSAGLRIMRRAQPD
ncbi:MULTISPECIES: hypothetical protein [unclassified Rhizobium]|uniref:hypothetical protein n=1 Tax=unclassified Rhizobium TaxID=2613769 RepID=UPI001ADBFCE2|nr:MULTISPECIES: hypothetical protein [unclassified Rhizobium]MBO9100539.1 hypothetical protein [Rhizobium sp. L58/93]MBO9136099.1 hypothetical protein [Rhizobium sp. B209b/85]MBO9171410.1 hypothetical protein [Rhizobium sp. L245/93]MBO9187277.1 hypothetical protein [Rhizobium sp. E27B/91]QXZ87956.1 hypothetical protein J5287_30235 [Rhizobium sp. K1/93]